MTRGFALPVAFLATVMLAAAGDQSRRNKSEEPDSFDIEPPILKQNLSNFLPAATPAPDADVARLEKRFEQAKQNAGGAERLCKIGVLSKVEMEQRLLRVVQYECKLADADPLHVEPFLLSGLINTLTTNIKPHVMTFFAQFSHRLVRNTALDFNVST